MATGLLTRSVGRRGPVDRRSSSRRSADTAALLHRIVDRDLALVRALPEHLRARPAHRLANLVLLAQAYRHHAAGWIGRRELRRRSRAILDELLTFDAQG